MNEAALSLVSVTKNFGGVRAVNNISMQVVPGERRVIIGPNGAGKTSLFHCISGALQATSGEIQCFGQDITHLSEPDRTQIGVGRTFQISSVFTELTVIENIALAVLGIREKKWNMWSSVNDIPDLERLPGSAGIKVFMGSSTGSLLVEDDPGVSAILAKTKRRAAFHAEDEYRLEERKDLRVKGDPNSHPIWRDVITALQCTQRLVAIARKQRAAIHVLHVSTGEEIAFLSAHKDVASVEVTPHHLTLDASLYDSLGTKLQMNPPVRDASHRTRIWQGLDQGIVDVLGSDHAPHTLEEKSRIYPDTPSGMTGVQTLVPIMLDHVNAGRLSLARFVDLSSAGPARIFQIARKGRIAEGYDADFTIVDMKRRETILDSKIASRAGWTPYHGKSVTGWPIGTIVRGHQVMWDGDVLTPAQGEAVRFIQAL